MQVTIMRDEVRKHMFFVIWCYIYKKYQNKLPFRGFKELKTNLLGSNKNFNN
jgi:hypothetical protein